MPPMPTDDHLHYHDPKNTPEEEEHSFDKLAKGLAAGTLTRGQVLKLAGAALLGSVFGGLFGLPASEAQSQRIGGGGGGHHHHRHHHHHHRRKGCPSGTTRCGKSCCTSSEVCSNDACTACGTLDKPCCANSTCTAGGTTCNASGSCVCSSGTTPCGDSCCTSSEVCSDNTCTACGGLNQPCCANSTCTASGTTCNVAGTCVACQTCTDDPCCPTFGADQFCWCDLPTVEGKSPCTYTSCGLSSSDARLKSCTSSSDCGPKAVCIGRTGGSGECWPLCSNPSSDCIESSTSSKAVQRKPSQQAGARAFFTFRANGKRQR